MKISLIAAVDSNLGIGSNNQLIWHLPDDFKWFKKHTLEKPLLMGKNTMLSLGKPLKNRLNIVVSSSGTGLIEGFVHASSIDEALQMLPKDTPELMVIGGGMIYKQLIEKADRLYITHIQNQFENMDTYFPEWNTSKFKEVYREHHAKDDKHEFAFDLCMYDKIN
jgi:dihydrofolate reductase